MKRLAGLFIVMILIISITGCAIGNKGTMHYNRMTTIGKELIDLKEAKDKGLLSDEEYNKVREDLLESKPVKFECAYGSEKKTEIADDCK